MASNVLTWALPRLEKLLPLDQESLKEILIYANSLPKDASADHLKNLLGDSPQALEFISSFNQRRKHAPSSTASIPQSRTPSRQPSPPQDGPSRSRPRQQKKKQNIHTLPARRIQAPADVTGAYVKKDEQDYMAASSRQPKPKGNSLASAISLSSTPSIVPQPPTTSNLAVSTSAESASHSPTVTPRSSRTSSPAPMSSPAKSSNPKAKITLVGGKAMHGASTALNDLDSAIRSLELQTNPLLSSAEDDAKRQCSCMATQHPLLTTAPNCTTCGKIICVKQGLGPCTFCKTPLLSSDELQSILRVLKDERGKERQTANNAAHKRAEVTQKPKAFSGRDFLSANTPTTASPLASSGPSQAGSRNASPGPTPASSDTLISSSATSGTSNADLARAKEHRDKLLNFQAQNAKRTQIHDEAADYAMPVLSGDGGLRGNMWASPAERAMELKRQQKILREMEFNARPEWEKKKVVGSIDVRSGKIVRRFVKEKFQDRYERDDEQEAEEIAYGQNVQTESRGEGAFSRNPLLGKMIRPVWKAEEQGKGKGKAAEREEQKRKKWRRVQDDLDDNEGVILDGGVYGRDMKVA
ncbi:hypothetical protein KVT40_002826 [Elsinoe batatas]|uniref:TRIP4/RQT4 C2HC5-type zinc finger domain-containing protein n=1 Tax=Elsinoe batatas TaxID=2601811 RepID=A0A8K0L2Y7_9PEZI|nr:hypothetical protein KVT40_002826 [Elsinoe batatas]